MMLPLGAHFARRASEELAHSALPRAPMRRASETAGAFTPSPLGRRRVAAALRRTADRLEPVAD